MTENLAQKPILETLPNGLQLVMAPLPAAQSVSLGIWVRTGGRFESAVDSGVSHFIEHLVFKGTQRWGCEALKRQIEGVGGSINAFTAEEFTCYMAKLPRGYDIRGLDVLSELVARPKLQPRDFEREREVIIEEIRMYEDQPGQLVFDLFHRLLWPGHPLGALLSGTEKSVRRLTHDRLMRYWQRHYHPRNWVVSAVGHLDPDAFRQRVMKTFGRLKPRPGSKAKPAPSPKRSGQALILNKPTEQAHVCVGAYAGARMDADRFAAELLNVILGANTSSRLFRQARERRGLVYDISSHVKRFQDTGAYVIYAGCDPSKLKPTLRCIRDECRRLAEERVSAAELKRARDFFIGQFLLGLEDTMEHMLWLGEQVAAMGRLSVPEHLLERIRAVDPEAVRRAARRLFLRPKHLSVVGPVETSMDKALIAEL